MATYKNINGDYVVTTLNASDEITLTSANIRINGPLSVNGNITSAPGYYFFGDGQFLANVVANVGAATKLQNGTSNVDIPTYSGNITFGVTGVGNVIVVSSSNVVTAINQRSTISTPSISNFTGAIVVAGGVGVAGNIYADDIYANNQQVLNVVSIINGGTF